MVAKNAEATPRAGRHPVRELLCRYVDVFLAAWAQRSQLAGPKLLADERAFLPAALELQETPPHPAPRRAAIVLCLLFVVLLLWAIFGRIDIVAVAEGRIVVSQGSKMIQPLETSVVKSIHVKNGDKVRAGQLVIALDATATQADSNLVGQSISAAWAGFLLSQSLIKSLETGVTPQFFVRSELSGVDEEAAKAQLKSNWADISAKLAKFDAEVARRKSEVVTADHVAAKLQSTLPMVEQREVDMRSLTEQGFVASHAVQDRTRERVELSRDLSTALARRNEAQAALRESERSRSAYKAEMARLLGEQLAQSDLKIRQLTEEGRKAEKRNQLTQLEAPVAGTVQQLAIHTPGGVVTPAQILLVIVPDDAQVTAEVVLENKDIGFVYENQEAAIKLEAFPFTRYGTVAAKVRSISADAVNDEKRGAVFHAALALEETGIFVDGRRIKLTPGLNVTAEIKTGKRRVIEYLLSPVTRHLEESMKER